MQILRRTRTLPHSEFLMFTSISGSPCRNYEGYCDVFYKCRQIDTEGALKRLLKFFDASSLAEIEQWMQVFLKSQMLVPSYSDGHCDWEIFIL